MRRTVLVAALCALMGAPAWGDMTVYVKEVSVSPGQSVSFVSSGLDASSTAGVYNLYLSGVAGVPASWTPYLSGNVQSFCIDLYNYSSTSTKLYDIMSLDDTPDTPAGPMGSVRAGYLARLFDMYWTPSLTAANAAALQIAVWEIVDEQHGVANPDPAKWNARNDTAGGLPPSGNFYVGNDTQANLANTMLGAVRTAGMAPFADKYVGLSNDDLDLYYQDFVVKVPVPGALLLGFLGLSAAGLRLRRFA